MRSGFPGMQKRCASNKYTLFVSERRGQHEMFVFYCCFLVKQNERVVVRGLGEKRCVNWPVLPSAVLNIIPLN